MRMFLFFLLFAVRTVCLAQDTLYLNWGLASSEVTSSHIEQINNYFNKKSVERVEITAYFSSEGKVSANRLLAELRLFKIKSNILNRGIPFNMVFSELVLDEVGAGVSDMKIQASFADPKEAGVLKKSPIVQISKFDMAKPRETPSSQQGESIDEDEIVLDEAAFKKDATVSLPNLIFIGSSHYFISGSERVLRALLKVMKRRTDIHIELQGHVCCNPPGIDAFDKDTGQRNLSVMRAMAVYNYLIAGGISPSRMTYRGFGSSRRLYPDEKTPTEQMLNRRVEVLITASD